jgi:hypothetical protein
MEAFGGTAPRLPAVEDLHPAKVDDVLFELVAYRTYPWTQRFDAKSYLETLATYSDHRDLSDASRTLLYSRLATLITDEMGGQIQKHWAACLTLVRRR